VIGGYGGGVAEWSTQLIRGPMGSKIEPTGRSLASLQGLRNWGPGRVTTMEASARSLDDTRG
jgi:hypothetical protein